MPLIKYYGIILFSHIKSYQAPQVGALSTPILMLGIVFDTREKGWFSLDCWGIVFDTYEGSGILLPGWALLLLCWVSFSIPMRVVGFSCLGGCCSSYDGYRFRYLCE